jgi:biopolymer transport protein ExbB
MHKHQHLRAILAVALGLLACTVSSPSARADEKPGADVERAYKREFAFLEAEKNTLQMRIREFTQQSEAKLRAARADLDALEGQVMAATVEADRLAKTLLDIERQAEGLEEGEDVIENLLTQASSTLEKSKVKLPEAAPNDAQARAAQLDFAFAKALEVLSTLGTVRKEAGAFFLADGTKVNGTLLRVGNVAAYGVSDRGAGALAPAGGGELKVWPAQPSAASAHALVKGERPSSLDIFLFEALDKAVEAKGEVSLVEHVTSGGLIAWVIVGGGVLALLMILARAVLLWRAAANTGRLVEAISPLVAQKRFRQAIEICTSVRSASGRVLKATLENIERPREQLEDIISEAVLQEQPVLDRFGASIMVLAAVSPLLGLLGTVTGMIATFDVITEFGTGNPKLLSGGISEALITTELGLVVAIPALLCGNLLSGWADRIKDGMDKSALHITNVASGLSSLPPESSEASASAPRKVMAT